MILTIFTGIAEFERELTVERTALGRVAAQGRAVKFGKPFKLQSKQLVSIKSLLVQGNFVIKINPSTVFRNIIEL
jgi:DNA invertase Pin-like site-specific DNA recombinase